MRKIQLTKSFRLLRFLNAQPPWPGRVALGGLAALGALVFTGRGVLAREMWRRIYTHVDVKVAMRRLAWYGAKGWMGLQLLPDPVFDFAEGLDARERDAVRRFLRRKSRSVEDRHLDRLTLTASEAVWPMPAAEWQALMARFGADVDGLLDRIHGTGFAPSPPDIPAPRKGDFSVSDAGAALADFAALFPLDQYPWYVISGTFLGIVREGGFLSHDYDIDVGMNAEQVDLDAVAARARASQSFFLHKYDIQHRLERSEDGTIQRVAAPILMKLVHRTGLHIDLFVHYLDDGIRWHGSSVHRWENAEFELQPYTLSGVDVLGPVDADRYLTENYGTWQIPVTEFNPSTGTPNLRMVHNLNSLVLFLRRYTLAYQDGAPSAANRIEEMLLAGGYLVQTDVGIRFNPDSFSADQKPLLHSDDFVSDLG